MAKEKGSKKGKIGAIEEFVGIYPDEWLLLEVLEVNEYEELAVGRLIAHDPLRTHIYEALRGTTIKDVALIYSGDMPKKGTTVMF